MLHAANEPPFFSASFPLYQMMGSEPQSQVKQSPRLQAGWHLRDGAGPELGSGQVSG